MRAIQLLLITAVVVRADLKSNLGLEPGDLVVMAGDSITSAQRYSNYIAAWFALNYPEGNYVVPTLARSGSSTGSWYNEEYEKRVYALDPDVVFLMLGHNDGSDAVAQANGTQLISDKWIVGGTPAVPVLLGAHPASNTNGKPVLELFNKNYETIGTANSYLYARNWDRLAPTWIADFNNNHPHLVGGVDGVHPGAAGHILIAWSCLKELGVVDGERLISSATINAAAASITTSSDCKIFSVSTNAYSGVDFDRLDDRLPWAIDESGRADAEKLIPGSTTWQDYLFKVTNLAAGEYEIYCGGVLVTRATNSELASGINLSGCTEGPVWAQGQETLRQIRLFQGIDPVSLVRTGPPWTGVENYLSVANNEYTNKGLRGAALKDKMGNWRTILANMNKRVTDAAQPVTRSWSIRLGAPSDPADISRPKNLSVKPGP